MILFNLFFFFKNRTEHGCTLNKLCIDKTKSYKIIVNSNLCKKSIDNCDRYSRVALNSIVLVKFFLTYNGSIAKTFPTRNSV